MITCTKCGAENEENAKFCVSCGAALYPVEKGEDIGFVRRSERRERRMEKECFGLPYGGAIAGIIFGAFIIIIGAALGLGIDVGEMFGRWLGTFVLIIIGVLIVAGAIYGLSRRRS